MERLTYWNEEYGCWSYHCGSGEAANRLAAYEETGRTPEEVTALGNLFDYVLEESKTLTGQLALLNRIRDLARADRAGRLVVLPCQVGTATYYIRYPIAVYPDESEPEIKRGIFTLCDLDRVGHSVFLTREEAEKVLEAKKNEQDEN